MLATEPAVEKSSGEDVESLLNLGRGRVRHINEVAVGDAKLLLEKQAVGVRQVQPIDDRGQTSSPEQGAVRAERARNGLALIAKNKNAFRIRAAVVQSARLGERFGQRYSVGVKGNFRVRAGRAVSEESLRVEHEGQDVVRMHVNVFAGMGDDPGQRNSRGCRAAREFDEGLVDRRFLAAGGGDHV